MKKPMPNTIDATMYGAVTLGLEDVAHFRAPAAG